VEHETGLPVSVGFFAYEHADQPSNQCMSLESIAVPFIQEHCHDCKHRDNNINHNDFIAERVARKLLITKKANDKYV